MRSDDGFGLLETLIALIILSVSVVVIAGAMGVSVVASNRHRAQAEGHALLMQVVEALRSPEVPFITCSGRDPGTMESELASEYLAALHLGDADETLRLAVLPNEWTSAAVEITDVKHYTGAEFGDACNDDPESDFRLALQLITVEVTDPEDHDVEKLAFVKGPS